MTGNHEHNEIAPPSENRVIVVPYELLTEDIQQQTDQLISEHVELGDMGHPFSNARLRDSGISVHALVGEYLPSGDAEGISAAYGISLETFRGAIAFYYKYTKFIDARLLLESEDSLITQ